MMLGITMGDPAGVGPEIIVKALANDPALRRRCVVYGAKSILEYYNNTFGHGLTVQTVTAPAEGDPDALRVIEPVAIALEDFEIGKVSPACGNVAFRCLEAAVKAAQAGEIGAIVTAPLNKEAMNAAGHHYDGHTGALAHLTNTPRCAMLLWTDLIKVIHVTTHVSMRQACDMIQ